MMRNAPHVSEYPVQDDLAYYTANTALDDVLAWFVSDGYTRDQMDELVAEHVERVLDDFDG